ncbi:MAG: hypothetical protein KDB27_17325 [Planctomycetales bacterium]|nr:hypothetical protein [Planctomycetales bacterium]
MSRATIAVLAAVILSGTARGVEEKVTYIFDESGGETFRPHGGLTGSLGTYDLVGKMQLQLNHETGEASIDWNDIVLQGTAGRSFDRNGTAFSDSLLHPLESLTGVFQDPSNITFHRRTDLDGGDLECPIIDRQILCEFGSEAFDETRLLLTTTEEQTTLGGLSLQFRVFDGFSAQFTQAVPEPASCIAFLLTLPLLQIRRSN